jgi:flavin reductase (DIM6/NTAB) family NADH-FMN oxidoreductase RutF
MTARHMLDPDSFRSVLGRFASGVTVVTTVDPDTGRDQGMTVTAFCSLSLEPPLVLFCAERRVDTHHAVARATHFAVNILCDSQEPLARRFSGPDLDRFDGIGFRRGSTGAAILDDVLAYLECERVASHDGGDHTIFVGEVQHATTRDGRPLLYYRGGYAQLER